MTRDAAIDRFKEATKNVKTSTTIALWTCLILSAGLLIASWIVPPRGAIDPSCLKGTSLLFAFAGLFELREAILEGLGVKLTHGSTTIEVRDHDGKPASPAAPSKTEE